MARKKNYLLYAGILVAVGLGVAYYKKWPPLMKFIHAPKAPPVHPQQQQQQHPMAPQMPPQQGVHPMGVMPGAVATQPGYGFGGGMMQMPMMPMPQQYPQMMPQMPMMPQTMPMMQPTLMPGMPYGQVV